MTPDGVKNLFKMRIYYRVNCAYAQIFALSGIHQRLSGQTNKLAKLVLVFSLFSFTSIAQAKLQVFACEPEWAALAVELGGDEVTVFSATTAMQDPHRIQARPSLIAKMRRADLVICNGAGLEAGWLPVLLRRAANPAVQPGQAGVSRSGRLCQPAGYTASRGSGRRGCAPTR